MPDLTDYKIRSGLRVTGPNTSDGALHSWYVPNMDFADALAKVLVEQTGAEYELTTYLGSWRKVGKAVEFEGIK